MSIGKCQQFLRFIFGLMIFLLLFSGGLSRPLSAHAAGGFGGIEIAADFNFSPVIAAADGIFSEIFRKAGAGITAVADFCVGAGETFGREIAAAGRKIAGGAQSFSATAGATAGRGAASLKSGISETKNDLLQGAAAVKDEVFPEFCRRAVAIAAAGAGFTAALGEKSEQKITAGVKTAATAGNSAIKNAFAGIAIVGDMGQVAGRAAASGIFAANNAGRRAGRAAMAGVFAVGNAGQRATQTAAAGISAAGNGFSFATDTAGGAIAAGVYNLGDAFGQTLGLAGDILELGRGNVAYGWRVADYDLKIAARAGQASVAEFFDGVKNGARDRLRRWLGIEDPQGEGGDQLSIINDNDDDFSKGSDPFEKGSDPFENVPATIVQNIYPEREIQTKEIQTIHTKEVQIKTETIVVDGGTKDTVEHISRQLDSDRPNYSLGQVFSLPSSLDAKTLRIGDSLGVDFTVDRDGNAGTNNLNVAGDAVIRGNLTVAGAQTYSGAARFEVSTDGPALTAIQNGAGAAFQADDILLKDYKIDFSGLGSLEIDSNGYLILASQSGKIKAADGSVFYTAGGHPINAPGEEILRASTPIFGFDIPARTAAGDFVAISKEMVLSGDSFPAAMEGTARVHKLNIVYADDGAAFPSSWRIYNITDSAAGAEFAVPPAQTSGLTESATYITAELALPAAGKKWRVEAMPPAGKTIQVYRISLEVYDRID
jgi:hypothetical protein